MPHVTINIDLAPGGGVRCNFAQGLSARLFRVRSTHPGECRDHSNVSHPMATTRWSTRPPTRRRHLLLAPWGRKKLPPATTLWLPIPGSGVTRLRHSNQSPCHVITTASRTGWWNSTFWILPFVPPHTFRKIKKPKTNINPHNFSHWHITHYLKNREGKTRQWLCNHSLTYMRLYNSKLCAPLYHLFQTKLCETIM